MQKKSHNRLNQEKGNTVLITTILLLVMTIIIAATINVSGMQFDLSMFQRNTSNTYYLAKSAVEKQVDMINKAIQSEMTSAVEVINNERLIAPLGTLNSDERKRDTASLIGGGSDPYQYLIYEAGKLQITGPNLRIKLENAVFDLIKNKYNGNYIYEVKSDRQKSSIVTEVQVKVECTYDPVSGGAIKDIYKITATATSKDGTNVFDTQTVEAEIKLNIPDPIDNEVREKYEWVGNPPEILNSAIVCFTDMIVTSGASLEVNGDVRVKGTRAIADATTNYWPDADESGGLIVSNGGKLDVKKVASATTTVTSGNIYSINNVVTTNGFTPDTALYNRTTSIQVEGDIVASTVGILDDYYSTGPNQTPFGDTAVIGEKVRNNYITAANIFVDNDVKIDKWVGQSSILASGSIFGISNNSFEATGDDPNSSSGVFNQGYGTKITANQMFVNGQPFIVFSSSGTPSRLYESIGEPFDAVAAWGKYASVAETHSTYPHGDESYLAPGSPFLSEIKTSGIIINKTVDNLYATAAISATVAGAAGTTSGGGLMFQTQADQLFFKGDYLPVTSTLTSIYNALDEKRYIFSSKTNSANYYEGNAALWKNPGMYKKFYNQIGSTHLFDGLRAYMTAMRSVFYGRFKEGTGLDAAVYSHPQTLDFSNVVNMSAISGIPSTWSYSNPIVATTSGNIDISDYYINEGVTSKPHLTIIINATPNPLTIKTSLPTNKKFKGVIISEGDVVLEGALEIEGSIIVGGAGTAAAADRKDIMLGTSDGTYKPGLKIAGSGTDVKIINNPNVLLEMDFANPTYLRQVLDALKITQYSNEVGNVTGGSVKHILGPYNYIGSPTATSANIGVPISYSMGHTVLTKGSTLDIKTEQINVSIKNMKKIY